MPIIASCTTLANPAQAHPFRAARLLNHERAAHHVWLVSVALATGLLGLAAAVRLVVL